MPLIEPLRDSTEGQATPPRTRSVETRGGLSGASLLAADRVDWYLWNWGQWHFLGRTFFGEGYDSHASLCASNCSREFDAMYAEMCERCALAVEAIIDGLPPAPRAALHHAYLEAVYGLRDYAAALAAGMAAVQRGLTARGFV
jgi:hypothetical protein